MCMCGLIRNFKLKCFGNGIVLYLRKMNGMFESIDACCSRRLMDAILHSLEKDGYDLVMETVTFARRCCLQANLRFVCCVAD